jgi:hypothetical protein
MHAEVSKWLRVNRFRVVDDWPAHSPDLNPIETCWSHVSSRVSRCGPVSQEDLEEFVKAEWNGVPVATFDNLVQSFRKRLQRCVEADGATVPP